MFKEFSDDNSRDDDFLNEFRQKIADQNIESFDEKKEELKQSKNIFLGVAGGVILAGIVGWTILAPQYAVEGDHEIPVIRRPQTSIRVQPAEPGGMDIPNQDKTVYNILDNKDDESVENILPPPEAPMLPVVSENLELPDENEELIADAEKIINKTESKDVSAEDIIKQAEEQVVAVEKTTIKDEVQNFKDEIKKVEQDIKVENKKVVEQAPVKAVEPVAPQKTETVKKVEKVEKTETKAVKTATKVKETPKAAVSGNWQIQLMSSPNKPAVEKAKIDLGNKYKISHLPFEIEAAVLDMNKTFYRLKVGAYTNRAEADKLCNNIKSLGGTCIVKKK